MVLDKESKLPIVEINEENTKPNTAQWKSTSDSIRQALESYGCLVVEYAKAKPDLQTTLFALWDELFDLPLETKKTHTSDLVGVGYDGNYDDMPLYEAFGIEDGGSLEATKGFTKLMWPQGHDRFCETVYSYCKLLMELDHTVINMIASSYGAEKHTKPLIESIFYMTRLIKYKAQDDGDDEGKMGLIPHKDKGFMALISTNEVRGLEIELPNGEWVHFEPSPTKFAIVAGEVLMAWSNGRIYSPQHKVVPKGTKEKRSIALFSFIRGMIEVPEELVDDENPLKYKPFSNFDFLEYCKSNVQMTVGSAITSYCGI